MKKNPDRLTVAIIVPVDDADAIDALVFVRKYEISAHHHKPAGRPPGGQPEGDNTSAGADPAAVSI